MSFNIGCWLYRILAIQTLIAYVRSHDSVKPCRSHDRRSENCIQNNNLTFTFFYIFLRSQGILLGHLGSQKILVVSHFGPFWTTAGRGIRYPWFLDHFLDVFGSLVEPQCFFFGPFGFTKKKIFVILFQLFWTTTARGIWYPWFLDYFFSRFGTTFEKLFESKRCNML